MGEKIGEGIGGTRKEAHKLAAGKAIQNLASKIISFNSYTLAADMMRIFKGPIISIFIFQLFILLTGFFLSEVDA